MSSARAVSAGQCDRECGAVRAVIVVGGEALVDLVPAPGSGATGATGALLPRPGGGPFNIAVALGRLGMPVALLARLSTDAFGAAQLARLAAAGVDGSLVRRAAEPTALAVATLRQDGSAAYTFYTAGTAMVGFADPGPLPPAVRAVSLGSLGLVLEPAASGYEVVLHRESAAGRLVALDPNVRPELIADAAAYRARFLSWLPSVGLLKLSVEDAGWLAGGGDPRAAVAGWLGAGPRAVVLTDGPRGLTAYTATGFSVSSPAVQVAVADTIGAGDTVQAALLARLYTRGVLGAAPESAPGSGAASGPGNRLADLDEDGWRDVLSFAARAAAVTCSRPGADPPWASELASPA